MRFSLVNLFELVLAYGIIAAILRGLYHQLEFSDFAVFLFIGTFYPVKVVLGAAARKHRALSVLGYTCLAAALTTWMIAVPMIAVPWNAPRTAWIERLIMTPLLLLPVPLRRTRPQTRKHSHTHLGISGRGCDLVSGVCLYDRSVLVDSL